MPQLLFFAGRRIVGRSSMLLNILFLHFRVYPCSVRHVTAYEFMYVYVCMFVCTYVGRYVRSCVLRFTLFRLSSFVLCVKPGADTVVGEITLLRFCLSRSSVLRSLYVRCICIWFVSVYGSVHCVLFVCSFVNTWYKVC